MKKILSFIRVWQLLLFVAVWLQPLYAVKSDLSNRTLSFNELPTFSALSCKDVQMLYQDHDGYIWIATRNGLFQYDGYSMVSYKSNYQSPELLSDNNVYCVAEDSLHRLWIGTEGGLDCLDKRTGTIRKIEHEKLDYGVSQLLVTREGELFIGSEQGLYSYDQQADSFAVYRCKADGRQLTTTVKSLMQDHKGDIWVGTWSEGLYRIEQRSGKLIAYPKMNASNSAHVLYQDCKQRIWVGTWGFGLQLLHNPYDLESISWSTFTESTTDKSDPKNTRLSDNLIYSINEDVYTHTLWVGTRSGLSMLRLDDLEEGGRKQVLTDLPFQNYYPDEQSESINNSEVTSIMADRQGLMWVGTVGGGMNVVNTHQEDFFYDNVADVKRIFKTNSVRSMLVDSDGLLWMGISTLGFGTIDRRTGTFEHYTQWPELNSYRGITTVMDFLESPSTGHILIAVYDGGIFEIDKQTRRVRHYIDEPWICHKCVFQLYEDAARNLWVGTRFGLSMRTADGVAVNMNSLKVGRQYLGNFVCQGICEDANGHIWVATASNGVIRIEGKGDKWQNYRAVHFSVENKLLNSNAVNSIYCDSRGRIWVGTAGGGISLYDEDERKFIPVHMRWNLPGDDVVSIIEDRNNTLWLGTNTGIIKLQPASDNSGADFRLYTTSDGLCDNVFNRNAVTMSGHGELFFGTHRGYNSFFPENLDQLNFTVQPVITDIKVFNQSWAALTASERESVSPTSPGFTGRLELNHRQNNFSIEFSAMEYSAPDRNRYAYMLKGFDTDWQYTDAFKRFAYYNNLKAGTYTFYLKASNANGIWNDKPRTVKITILPPPWRTWWAYTLYVVSAILLTGYTVRIMRNRIQLKHALHLREMEKEKADELNHAKLQFFTNITHELLTPLTILRASVDDLKMIAPDYQQQYGVMNNNINRLIRLLQQILEFRKAETGNLKLKVSYGDLAQFIGRNIESFSPLIKQKDMVLTVESTPNPFMAYFDPDKLDKIIYNLISNAAKYNCPGEKVEVTLTQPEPNVARLEVHDNGPGIKKEAQKQLFKRFYEGDYRKFNTIGTGIGLSLVRDLVQLHHGTVTVESEEGEGASFIIHFPIGASSYSSDEIENEAYFASVSKKTMGENSATNYIALSQPTEESAEDEEDLHKVVLLIVEDNEELLQLMVNLLSRDYQVVTAKQGAEAQEVLKQQGIDLIVSDVMMPVMDGIELCKFVKNNFETSHIPFIMLTAKNQEEDRVEAYESGADAFITKPFSLSVLRARIDNLLRTRQQQGRSFKKQLVFEAKEMDYTSLDEEFLKQAIECVNRHLDNPEFDLAQFLEEMHTTKSTCFRKLKSLTGQTFVSFVRNLRMKAACKLIDENNHIRISEVAFAVGYSDPRYFSLCFRKEIGVLPADYAKKRQE